MANPTSREFRIPYFGQIGWALLALAVCGFVVCGNKRSVMPCYQKACERWVDGRFLYDADGFGFVYLPNSLLAFAPFAVLPTLASELAWRVFNIFLMALGLRRLSRLIEGDNDWDLFGKATFVCAPLCFSAARNGQMTLAMTGAMMCAAVELARQRWWRAAAWLGFAVVAKTLSVVLVLLAAAMYRKARLPIVAALALAFALPFALQDTVYVTSQYIQCAENVARSFDLGRERHFATLFGALQVAGAHAPPVVETVARGFMALATLAACLAALRRLPRERATLYLVALATLYIVLFNPRTESNTYAVLAPALGLFFGLAYAEGRWLSAWSFLTIAACVVSNYEFCRLFSPVESAIWLAPLAASVFMVIVIRDLSLELSNARGPREFAAPRVSTAPRLAV